MIRKTYSLSSPVERAAFRPRDVDVEVPDCERLLNGLWAEDESHCQRCRNLIRACRPRPYAYRDYLGLRAVPCPVYSFFTLRNQQGEGAMAVCGARMTDCL